MNPPRPPAAPTSPVTTPIRARKRRPTSWKVAPLPRPRKAITTGKPTPAQTSDGTVDSASRAGGATDGGQRGGVDLREAVLVVEEDREERRQADEAAERDGVQRAQLPGVALAELARERGQRQPLRGRGRLLREQAERGQHEYG